MKEAKEITTRALDRSESEILRTRNAMILLAIVGLGMAVAAQALGAGLGAAGPTVAHPGGGNQGGQSGSAFPAQRIERVPSMPPVFNQSTPYTGPQSPERPVSPASSGIHIRRSLTVTSAQPCHCEVEHPLRLY